MHVEIVGPNRSETRRVSELTRGALKGLGLDFVVQEVNELRGLAQHPSHEGTAIYIDGILVSSGRLIRLEDVQHGVRWRHPQAFSASN